MRRRPRARRWFVITIGAWIATGSTPAAAQSARMEARVSASLAWARADGAESCISAPELARAIEARLGYAVFGSPATAEVTLEGSVAPSSPAPGFRASFRVLDAKGAVTGSRQVEIHEAGCRALDDRAALIASLLVDDAAQAQAKARETKAPPTTPPAPPPAPPSATPPPPAPPPARTPRVDPRAPGEEAGWRFSLDLGLGVTTGLQPGVGLGLAATALLRPPHFVPFYLGAGLYPSTDATVPRGGTVAADVKLGSAGICPLALGSGRLELLGCGGVLVGSLDARGTGFDDSYADRAVLVSGAITARGAIRVVGPLAVYVGLGGHFALVRAEVGYREGQESKTAFASAPIGLFSDVGVGLRLP